jgi:hypothetical protein
VSGSNYATKEDWLAPKRASKAAYKERLKAGLVNKAPPGRAKPGPKPKYETPEERVAANRQAAGAVRARRVAQQAISDERLHEASGA